MWKFCTQTMGTVGGRSLVYSMHSPGFNPLQMQKRRTLKYCDHSFLKVTLLQVIHRTYPLCTSACVFVYCVGECACLWLETKTDIGCPSSITVLLTYLILLGLSSKLYLISSPRLVSQKTSKTHSSLPLQGLELQECTTCLVYTGVVNSGPHAFNSKNFTAWVISLVLASPFKNNCTIST